MAPRVWKLTAWVAAAAVLAGVFALYTRPQMMITLSDMVWSCLGRW